MPDTPQSDYDEAPADAASLLAMATIMPSARPPSVQPGASEPPLPQVPSPAPQSRGDGSGGSDCALTFRPRQRPPMALLCILFDGEHGGEWLALRSNRYVIGRLEGDIRISHDTQISGKQHAEITRIPTASGFTWQLADLGSTNGTFVMVNRATLVHHQELIFGQTRYRFDDSSQVLLPPAAEPAGDPLATVRPGTPAPSRNSGTAVAPALVEVSTNGDGPRVVLVRSDYWIGRDPVVCAIVPGEDPFVSPKHAHLFRGADGRWQVENNQSRNGVWLRLNKPAQVKSFCQFLLGEQRFILKSLL